MLLFASMQCVHFGWIKHQNYLFMARFNKEKLLEINALRRLKMLLQRAYSSKSSGGACIQKPPSSLHLRHL